MSAALARGGGVGHEAEEKAGKERAGGAGGGCYRCFSWREVHVPCCHCSTAHCMRMRRPRLMAEASAAARAASRFDRTSPINWRQICTVAWGDISASQGCIATPCFSFTSEPYFSSTNSTRHGPSPSTSATSGCDMRAHPLAKRQNETRFAFRKPREEHLLPRPAARVSSAKSSGVRARRCGEWPRRTFALHMRRRLAVAA
jgi:hypothetical protein